MIGKRFVREVRPLDAKELEICRVLGTICAEFGCIKSATHYAKSTILSGFGLGLEDEDLVCNDCANQFTEKFNLEMGEAS